MSIKILLTSILVSLVAVQIARVGGLSNRAEAILGFILFVSFLAMSVSAIGVILF